VVILKEYKLAGQCVQTPITFKKMNLTIVYESHYEDFVYVVQQSAKDQRENSLNGVIGTSEKIANYELLGTKISLFESIEDKLKVMRMIVPVKGKNSAYQAKI
jgi:bla regulator protein BlaR1